MSLCKTCRGEGKTTLTLALEVTQRRWRWDCMYDSFKNTCAQGTCSSSTARSSSVKGSSTAGGGTHSGSAAFLAPRCTSGTEQATERTCSTDLWPPGWRWALRVTRGDNKLPLIFSTALQPSVCNWVLETTGGCRELRGLYRVRNGQSAQPPAQVPPATCLTLTDTSATKSQGVTGQGWITKLPLYTKRHHGNSVQKNLKDKRQAHFLLTSLGGEKTKIQKDQVSSGQLHTDSRARPYAHTRWFFPNNRDPSEAETELHKPQA